MKCLHQIHFFTMHWIKAPITSNTLKKAPWPLRTKCNVYDQKDKLSFNIVHWNRYLFVIFHPFDSCTLHHTRHTLHWLHTCARMKKSLCSSFFCFIQVPLWTKKTMDKIWKKMLPFIYISWEHKEDLLAAKRRNQTCVTQFFVVAIVAGEFNAHTNTQRESQQYFISYTFVSYHTKWVEIVLVFCWYAFSHHSHIPTYI